MLFLAIFISIKNANFCNIYFYKEMLFFCNVYFYKEMLFFAIFISIKK